MEKIGDKLYNLRIDRDVSQEQLGEMIGVTRQTVSLWEANKRQISTDKLLLICKKLDASPEYFFLDVNDEKVVCAEVNQENQNEIIGNEPSSQKEKKKLSKSNKILLAIIVVAVVVGIIAIVAWKVLATPKEGFETAYVNMFNLDYLFWLIPGFASLVTIVAGIVLIKNNVKRK